MSALEKLVAGLLFVIAVTICVVLGAKYYGARQFAAGHAEAVAAGVTARQAQAAAYLKSETSLRADLAARDAVASRKEQDHAVSLEAAQRRVRAGTDSLRCPSSPIPAATPARSRPATTGPAPDGPGAELVPEAAADLLGDAATIAGLVRKFDRLEQRFEACRAMNAK